MSNAKSTSQLIGEIHATVTIIREDQIVMRTEVANNAIQLAKCEERLVGMDGRVAGLERQKNSHGLGRIIQLVGGILK